MSNADLGTSLTLQISRRFTCNPAGYRTTSPIRSPLMVNSDGYCRVMLCPTDMDGKIETWLAPVRKDFSFTGPKGRTNRRSRCPLLYTLDPLTLKESLISPTTACNASAGTSSPQGAGWGNMVPVGEFCVNEVGDEIVASYGGDLHDCSRFNKYTGQRVEFSCATGSNWSGVLRFNADGTFTNGGTANYWTVLQPVTKAGTDAAVYSVASSAAGYSITRTDATTGARTVHTLNLANVGTVTDVKTANGLLFVQSVKGMEVIISVVKGEKTPPLTLPILPASGYVTAPIGDMTLGTGEEIKPLKIAAPDPNAIDTGAVDPKYRHAYLFPVVDGQAFVRVIHAYMDQHSVLPSDLRLWLFPATWPEPSTRKNIPKPISVPITRRNVGKVGSGLYRIDFDVTVEMEVARLVGQPQIAFCLEGVAPPHYEKSKVYLIDQTRLITGGATPPPPVETVPKFQQVIDPSTGVRGESRDGKYDWAIVAGGLQVQPADGFNYVTAVHAQLEAPYIHNKTLPLPAGRYEISVTAKGPDGTRDSAFVLVNGEPPIQVNSFTPAGSTRVVGTFELADVAVISVFARECGLILNSILVKQL